MPQNLFLQGFKRTVLLLFFLLMLFLVSSCSRQRFSPHDSIDAFSAYFDKRIILLMNQYEIPGASIALIHNGKLAWSGAYGYANQEDHQKTSVDSVFRVESISKSLTAWGVMRLVEQGKIKLDAPVQQYLNDWEFPESEYPEQNITVRQLLSHNAGMPLGTIGKTIEYRPQSNMPSLRETLSHEAHLIREPGSGFMYSNTGFNFLELIIENITGRAFAEYMADEVLVPLGMNNSTFIWDEAQQSMMPTGYDLQGSPVSMYVYPVKASGGLLAPVEDIAQFVISGMTGSCAVNQPVLGQQSIHMLYTPQVKITGLLGVVADSYGLGYFIENLPDGRRAVWHGGQGHGWMSHFYFVPESGMGIVILTNSQRSWPFVAQLLNDWAKWNGFGSVKMGRIIYGITALQIMTGIIVLASLLQLYRLVQGIRNGNRRWSPLPGNSATRLLLAASGAIIITALLWCAAQPYLIVSSIFLNTATWTGISLFALAVIMILSALLPRVRPGFEQAHDRASFDFTTLSTLPLPVERYFHNVLASNQKFIRIARLHQTGELKINPESNRWAKFKASCTISENPAGFVWDARIHVAPFLHVRLKDSFIDGIGAGRIYLMSVIPIGSDENKPELNSGTLYRYLAEAVWHPTALLPQSGVEWEAVDDSKAIAHLSVHGISISLEFRFNDLGEITGVYTENRFGRFNGTYTRYPWEGKFSHYQEVNGMKIPLEGEVGWHLPEGWWLFWRGKIIDAEFEY